jgi:hypothetical protein
MWNFFIFKLLSGTKLEDIINHINFYRFAFNAAYKGIKER